MSEAYVVDVSTAAVVLQSGVSAANKARLKKHGAVSVNISMGALGAPSMKNATCLGKLGVCNLLRETTSNSCIPEITLHGTPGWLRHFTTHVNEERRWDL